MGKDSEPREEQVLSILVEQRDLLEKTLQKQQRAAEESAAQAVECAKLRESNDRLEESNKKHIARAEEHIASHERQTEEVVQLIDAVTKLLRLLERAYAEQLVVLDRLALVVGLLVSTQSSSMARASREQVEELLGAIKIGLKRSSVDMHTEVSSERDIVVGRDLNVKETKDG